MNYCLLLAYIDPQFAKEQILLMLREWYMHPNGQIPAYEWGFNDVNPPVLMLAARAVFEIERRKLQSRDPIMPDLWRARAGAGGCSRSRPFCPW